MTRTFSKRLKELRSRKKLSQEDLSIAVNIPRATIAGYESGARSLPREQRLKDIANFFGVSIDYMMGRTQVENESEDLESQIVDLFQNAKVHYDYKYTYTNEEKEKIVEILLGLANMEEEERKYALEMIARMAKKE